MSQKWNLAYKEKYLPPAELEERARQLRKKGLTLVTLNGSFDLLHAGHLQSIYEASQQGDRLIVALNSDSSIRQYKSSHRPIIPLESRLQMVAALSFVDFVTHFDETDPIALLEKIRPNVHCNGSEYGQNCIEAPCVIRQGGRLHVMELVPGLSTTQIIDRIAETCVF